MTLYYSLVFVLLVAEMALFVGLIVPMPFTIKRKMFNFISESPLVAKLQYGMKITFIFILILFLDSVNRVYRVQVEMASLMNDSSGAGRAAAIGSDRMEVQARKFYSQRNMYLTGFTLFLSLILNRTYGMILDVLRLEEKVKMYEGDSQAGGKEGEKLSGRYRADQIGELKKQLEKKDKQVEAMKSQSEGLQREYDQLSVKYNQTNPSTGEKKSN
ncbi:B-cell receptor-associated protein 31-like-domain-containing protein [Exophiala viscosa]|uniref:Endoplasmic reticulum transmembrane protein n=1 Tax=Exophiala viscosa TaxID=2486360 RepID=A0AAN6DPI9_9EURO|nr:B-cell receptor-associated protein 31-like-domain-containing protein [Exophiala viscosa]KAI1619722.1 B-cell receptor-associated protein 31-like-domain-containing protein [Exophiala viscosa]